ncbi:hypothetical protein N0V83_004397 [Neocucurbitaria cava]|uniref:BZIP domain-containing protein n=1 Tax=Neocucurbitaria cava TaxID=798079 RepID=A0A9W8YAK7_9PLEO|nr:hypothetical protein N0V83_004397 [Neocucurbitaria cava]
MPAERAKNTKTLGSVPDVGDPDRKRVLNVLAQRRYRQRRKEKVAALEAQTKAIPSPPDTQQHNDEQTEIVWEVPSDSCHGPRLEEIEEVEELGRMLPEESLQMFDFDQDPFGLNLMQDFNTQEDDDLKPSSLHPSQSPNTQDSPSTSSRDGGIRQSSAIVRLVQDLDDFRDGGGVRVHGNTSTWSEGNELVEEAWEIGDLFYRKWWWCLDQHVVEASNKKRGQRGLGKLRMVDTR